MDCEAVEKVLERCHSLMFDHLVLSPSVIEQLKEEDIISDNVKKKMTELDSNDQIKLLIDVLGKRGSSTFKRFLGVLRRTFHSALADKLVLCDPVRFSDALATQPLPYYTLPATDFPYKYKELRPPSEHQHLLFSFQKEASKVETPPATADNLPKAHDPPKYYLQEGKVDVDVDNELTQIRSYFEDQQSTTARVLAALKQEEVVIRELLDQNAKEQEQFRQNKSTLEEINRRVKEISSRTGYLADASPRLSVSDFRLATLNTLPWTAGKSD